MPVLKAWPRLACEIMIKRSCWLTCVLVVLTALVVVAPAAAQDPVPVAQVEVPGQPHADPAEVVAATPDIHGEPHGDPHAADDHHEESLWSFLARVANFALLAGGLFYFLRGPIGRYISGRQAQVRGDLALASDMRADAARRLTQIAAQLQSLPAELELVKQRGAEEVAAEEQRIQARAEVERARLVAQVRREIAQQTRTARQTLREHAASLTIAVADQHLRATLTPDEQHRLAEQYITRVGGQS
jgi:F-type H+-transporting ATPase subunit b